MSQLGISRYQCIKLSTVALTFIWKNVTPNSNHHRSFFNVYFTHSIKKIKLGKSGQENLRKAL